MNPYKLKNVFEYLTSNNQLLKKKLKLGTSEIPIPPKRDDVTTIEAINRFSKANPRVDTTNLKPLSVKQSNVKKPDEAMVQGVVSQPVRTVDPERDSFKKISNVLGAYKKYRRGEKNPKLNFNKFFELYSTENFAEGGRIGYDNGSKLTDFLDVQASGSKSGKQQIQGAPDGITSDKEIINAIITMDIPLTEKVNLIGDLQYGKFRDRIEYKDDEIYLDDPKSYRDRNIGLDFNRDGEGFSGSATVGDRGPEYKIRYKKSFADGGMLVQPSDDGSRPGYKGNIGQQKVSKKVSESSKKINKNINKWATNWFNKNQKNYGVRDFEKMKNDFTNAWSTELKENLKKYEGYGSTKKTLKMSDSGLPIIKDGISIDGIKFVTRADRAGNNPDLAWERLFYKNKLKNKDFKTQLKQYVEWATANKRKNPNLLDPNVKFGSAAQSKTGTLEYGKKFKGFNDDVIFFMGDVLNKKTLNPGGTIKGVTDVFKETLGKDADNYFKKFKGSWNVWVDNFRAVGKLAGLDDSMIDALLKKQKSDTQKIMKLYNVENLPLEFRVAQDHLFGLAEAKALGDPKIASQTLKNLVASTKEQNRVLGQEGFSNKRVSLIKKFKNANLENKANIVNQLNTLADEYVPGRLKYNIKKDGSLKITNLQPETTLKAKTSAYESMTETFPKNVQADILKKMGFKCKFAGSKGGLGNCDDPASYFDDINKTQADINSSDINVRNKAIVKNRKALQIAKTIPKIGKFVQKAVQVGASIVTTPLKALGLTSPIGLAIEGAVEGGIYDYYRAQGYNHDQAYAETFTPKIATDAVGITDTGLGAFEGAQTLLDAEKFGAVQYDIDGNEIGIKTGNPKGLAKQYDNLYKNYEKEFNIYANIANSLDQIKSYGGIDSNNLEDQLKIQEVKVNQAADAIKPGTPAYEAFQIAEENQAGRMDNRKKEYLEKTRGISEPSEFQIINKDKQRMKDMINLYPQYTDEQMSNYIIDSGFDPQAFRDKVITPKNFPGDTSSKPISAFQDVEDYVLENLKTKSIADAGGVANMASGGLANLTKTIPPESGPTPQGLPYVYNNVKKI